MSTSSVRTGGLQRMNRDPSLAVLVAGDVNGKPATFWMGWREYLFNKSSLSLLSYSDLPCDMSVSPAHFDIRRRIAIRQKLRPRSADTSGVELRASTCA